MIARSRIAKTRRRSRGNYERMMETLLLQNQQLIIQQQNMLFMFIKQNGGSQSSSLPALHQQQPQPPQSQQQHHQTQQQSSIHHEHHQDENSHQQSQHQSPSPSEHQSQPQSQQQPHHQIHHQHQSQSQSQQQHQEGNNRHHAITNGEQTMQSHQQHQHHHQQIFSQASNNSIVDTQQQLQQVAAQLQEHQGSYLTPAASEQDPIIDKQDEEDLAALLDGNGLLHNNFLYNPQSDLDSITPYKSSQNQHQTPSYYSSGCESLTTPRLEQQRPLATANINQNVVKNLADSFKSPTKPKINVQIMSSTATGSMKNSKAKIIQSMNISQFLRHVHPEVEPKTSSQ